MDVHTYSVQSDHLGYDWNAMVWRELAYIYGNYRFSSEFRKWISGTIKAKLQQSRVQIQNPYSIQLQLFRIHTCIAHI